MRYPWFRKLKDLPTDALIKACLEAADVLDAADKLGVERKTIRNELYRRGLPAFGILRKQNGVETYLGPAIVRWTDEMVDQRRKLNREGLSAQLIGEQLGMSKNSVCGKAHRLGLVLGRPRTIAPETKPRAPRPPSELKGKPRPPRAVVPVVPATNLGTDYRRPKVLPSAARQLAAERLAKLTRAADRELIENALAEGKVTKLPPGHAWGTNLNSWVQGLAS